MDERLTQLAAAAGIGTAYTDAWGQERAVPEAVIRQLAAALGYPADSEQDLAQSLAGLRDAPWRDLLPPVFVARNGEERHPVPLSLPADAGPVSWNLAFEQDGVRDGTVPAGDLPHGGKHEMDGRTLVRRLLALPDLPDGYHRLSVTCGEQQGECLVIAAPATCFVPERSPDSGRLAGLATQLYGLHSRRNWGIGDFTDLCDLGRALHGRAVDAIGVNPLHALFPVEPTKISPYSPSSRRFLNVLYIDVEAVDDFAECADTQALVAHPDYQARLAELRANPLVDYPLVAACKLPVLESLYQSFRRHHLAPRTERARDFERFREEQGEGLERFALHEALSEHASAGKSHLVSWTEWPEDLRDPDSAAVRDFARDHAERIGFHIYLQWIADRQLAQAARCCAAAGLRIGLYGDLALGVDGASGETWADQGLYATGASVGAPPDVFSPKGQSWGLPPLRPDALRARAYAPFIELVRANMRHFGALRIDHALGLRRLYWIPAGNDAGQGGYVNYPVEDLIAILKLESVRNRCIVVGEDLGTVPADFQDQLRNAGILSYRLLYFERGKDGGFKPPEDYPQLALVAVTTHDLPTLIAWWTGADIDLRAEAGLFRSQDAVEDSRRERERDRAYLARALSDAGLLPADFPARPDLLQAQRDTLIDAAHLYLARTPSLLQMVGAEDLLGLTEQVNLPGTTDQHPNWRRRLPVNLAALADNPHLTRLASLQPAED